MEGCADGLGVVIPSAGLTGSQHCSGGRSSEIQARVKDGGLVACTQSVCNVTLPSHGGRSCQDVTQPVYTVSLGCFSETALKTNARIIFYDTHDRKKGLMQCAGVELTILRLNFANAASSSRVHGRRH